MTATAELPPLTAHELDALGHALIAALLALDVAEPSLMPEVLDFRAERRTTYSSLAVKVALARQTIRGDG